MKKYRKEILCLLLAAGGVMLLIHLAGMLADKIIFQPSADTYPGLSGIEMLDVAENNKIAVRFSPPAQKDGLVFLHCHGNAENLRTLAWRQEMFASRGYGFCAFDYEGYGRSSGKVSEKAVDRDVMRVWEYLTKEKGIAPEKIVVHGFSLGTGAAVSLAVRLEKAKALILEAPFTSTYAVAGLAWVPGDRFPSIGRIPHVRMPVLIIHGDRDRIIPFRHGKKLYEKAPEPKAFFHVPGAGHNDLIATAAENYWRQLNTFLQKQ